MKRNPKILVVDDEERNLRLLEAMLIPLGHEILLSQNGEEALERVKTSIPDLILLDIMMPKYDGFMVCEILKRDPLTKEIPVIFLTAKTDTESILKGFGLGAVDYIGKPFNSMELIARVKTHLSLKQTQMELREANAAKDKFFSIIAHDLKNPFSSLLGYTGILLKKYDEYDDERKIQMIKAIRESSERVLSLLENLLDWSQKQLGQMNCDPELINLAQIALENISLLESPAKSKNIIIYSNIDEDTMAFGDLNMIKMVFRNLISNAIKFTNLEGEIQLSCKEIGDYQEVVISDTGVGIAEEDLENLFRIDVHHSTEGTKKERGSGLGLLLCKEFIEENGGKIWVKSNQDEGSKFYFTIPKRSKGIDESCAI